MTIFNWLAETWRLDNEEEEDSTDYSDDSSSYYQEPEQSSEPSYYQEPEQKSVGMFDWLWGSAEQNSESEPSQSYYREPEQQPIGMFDWLFGTPEQEHQSSVKSHHQEPEYSPYKRLDASGALNIQGDSHFVEKIQRSLDLLERHSPEDLQAIKDSSDTIKSSNTSGAAYWASRIDISREMSNTSDEYLAAVLVHEAEHNRRRKANKHLTNSVSEELDCITKQIQTLKNLNGSQYDIRQLESEDGTHYQREVTW